MLRITCQVSILREREEQQDVTRTLRKKIIFMYMLFGINKDKFEVNKRRSSFAGHGS
jgi:hypothetical protein